MTSTQAPAVGDPRSAALDRAIVDHAPEAIIVSTPHGEILFINAGAERLTGFTAKALVGKSILDLVPPRPDRRADPVKWLARWAAETQPEQARFLSFEARCADGRTMPVDVRVSAGEVEGAACFFITLRDNTARRQEQMAFKDASLRAARILLVAEDAIVSCDAQQKITFFNLKAEQMFGYRAEEVVGQPLAVLLPPAQRDHHAMLVEAFGQGHNASRLMSERAEVVGLRRNGQTFPVEATITKVAVHGELSYTAHIRDITARKAAEARLKESERRLRAMFEHADSAIGLLAPDGRVLEINRAAHALTVGGESLIGRPLWELPWLGAVADPSTEERGRLKAAVEAAAAGLTVRYTTELPLEGEVRRIDLTLTPIRDEQGQVAYILPEGHERRD